MRTLERMWREFEAANYIEVKWSDRVVFRIGAVGILVILGVETTLLAYLIGLRIMA